MRSDYFTPTQAFDKFLTQYRYNRMFKALKQFNHIKQVYDLGCGSGQLVHLLCEQGYDAYGIDVKSDQRIIAADLNNTLPLSDESVDLITSLANIEHLEKPLFNLHEIYRVLRKNGVLILTTPSTAAKPILEFLAYKLKWINETEIRDHKIYFSKKLLEHYLQKVGFHQFQVKRFQMGLNLHAIAIK
ncbi:methyltransferase domain-containing protein [Candidatus Berkiella aquae]|uniref:Class I SAM-dependent methyltransferase n=1 Tax=Candidatus Berkiella aquae TaxID=295108 RepID=A0A0Q9YS98_9GAMM|nr:class I SAM-dependent methyltransferase [Candidatus Berkiella aquae]MCS5712301.1 class I SAM-dependent methyltransferase [Candidatus Berkiella aquae]